MNNLITPEENRKRCFDRACEGIENPEPCKSRTPVFGEKVRGIWASVDNPIRDGLYVQTIVRTGKTNRGEFFKLTNGKGKFWEFWRSECIYLNEKPEG